MRQRRHTESRLNRALNELLGSGHGVPEALRAIEDAEALLRSLAAMVGRLD